MVSGEAREVRTSVTDRGRDLKLDTSLQDLHNMELPARSVVTVVIGLEDATGISDSAPALQHNGAIYNVLGQRMSKMQRGINIKDGRKIAK